MVQKEAADRLAAAPGTRASSAISCAVSYYATSKMMFTAAPGSFYPAPKVTSAVVRMEIRPQPAVQVEDEEGYFALVRAAFGQRRKTAANAIASGLGMSKDAVTAAIEAAGFDARIARKPSHWRILQRSSRPLPAEAARCSKKNTTDFEPHRSRPRFLWGFYDNRIEWFDFIIDVLR